jgi:transcriptional regulator with PAS, ATPase and Fis domain
LASVRNSAAQIARMFSAAQTPVYAVDQDREIVFVNQSCAQWLGSSVDALVGQRCDYHSSPENEMPAPAATAICPPPEVFSGEPLAANVCSPQTDSEQPTRRVHFLPIGDTPSSCTGVIAIARETPPTKTAPDDNNWPSQLHAQLAEFRKSLSGNYALDRLAGNSPTRRRVREQVKLASQTDAGVLIVGPPGSGRQHAARTIHELANSESHFVPLDCAVAPQGLVEHLIARASEVEQPSGRDTLLLVDVDQLAVDAQSTLAELMAGENFPYRTIATTTQSLAELAQQGLFREDLACRLGVLSIELPNLQELGEDLPLLAQWFLEAENAHGKKQLTGFTDAAMQLLLTYEWPGNMDELAEVVRNAHRTAGNVHIAADDLPQRLRLAADQAIQGSTETQPIELESVLADVEIRLIRQALESVDGNKSQAAKQLGMTRQRFYRRLEQLGLEETP